MSTGNMKRFCRVFVFVETKPGVEQEVADKLMVFDEVIENVDVLMALRIQLERQGTSFFPSLREYHNFFGITRERLEKANKPITIMHPGPINRGVEISSDVADSEHSVILDQVTNGVAIRMSVLYLLSGGQNVTEQN